MELGYVAGFAAKPVKAGAGLEATINAVVLDVGLLNRPPLEAVEAPKRGLLWLVGLPLPPNKF